MKKLLNKPWFVAALAAIALFLVGHSVWPWLHASTPAGDEAAAPEPDAATAPEARPSIEAVLQSISIQGTLRDPFAPRRAVANETAAAEPAAALPDLVETVTLAALWTQHGETLALINGQILQAGDAIGRLRIESASDDGVWVRHWKGRDFIALGATFRLVTPAAHAGSTSSL